MKKLLVGLGLFLCAATSAHAVTKAEMAEDFCYAQQAALMCDNLKMRRDTEEKVDAFVGTEVRSNKSPYSKQCDAGFDKALDEQGKGLCEHVWRDFGCQGTVVSGLVQQNPFKVANPVLCSFKG